MPGLVIDETPAGPGRGEDGRQVTRRRTLATAATSRTATWCPRRGTGRPGAARSCHVHPASSSGQQRRAADQTAPVLPAVELSIQPIPTTPALSKTSDRRARPPNAGARLSAVRAGALGARRSRAEVGRAGAHFGWSRGRATARPRDRAASLLLGLVSGGRLVVAKEPGSMRPSPAGRQRRSRVGGRLTQHQEHRARRTPATPGRQAATVVVATKRGRSCPQ